MFRRLFVKWHGEGEPHQADLFRCESCKGLVTWNMIRAGNTCCSSRLRPTNPRFFEKVRLFLFPWAF